MCTISGPVCPENHQQCRQVDWSWQGIGTGRGEFRQVALHSKLKEIHELEQSA